MSKQPKTKKQKSDDQPKPERKKDVFTFIEYISKRTNGFVYCDDNKDLYNQYIVNKAFSFHVDTVLAANEMNMCHSLSDETNYLFYINSIRPKSRFSKIPWKDKDDAKNKKISLIVEYYKCNNERAREIMSILSEDQIAIIKQELEKGGTK